MGIARASDILACPPRSSYTFKSPKTSFCAEQNSSVIEFPGFPGISDSALANTLPSCT